VRVVRAYIRGPSFGPVRTTLWSSRSHRRHVKGAGWLYLVIFAAGGITWAWIAAVWLGILVTIAAALIVALAVYGLLAAHAEMDRRRRARRKPAHAAAGEPAGWKAEHVPASAEYRAAHPEGLTL
jgi:hypothetical protein